MNSDPLQGPLLLSGLALLALLVVAGSAFGVWRSHQPEITKGFVINGERVFDLKRKIQPNGSTDIREAILQSIAENDAHLCPRHWTMTELKVLEEQPKIVFWARLQCSTESN